MNNIISKYTGRIACSILVGMSLVSCSDDTNTIPQVDSAYCPNKIELQIPDEFAKFIYVDNTGAEVLPLIVGESVALKYTLAPDDITFSDVQWSSSNDAVATVKDGVVNAVSEKGLGYSIINVSPMGMYSGSGVNATLKVKVADHLHTATGITLSAESYEAYEGETIAMNYEIAPESATYRTLSWSSSDESVATVDSKGVVTGVSAGTTGTKKTVTITATAMDGSGTSASQVVTIKRVVDPENVTIDQKYSVNNGYYCAMNEQTLTLDYTTDPEDCTKSQIKWTSSDENVATVADGVVTYVNYGDVTITATCPNGNSSSIKLSIPKGLLRETYHNQNHYSFYNAQQSGNGTSTSNEWHDGYITITTYTANATTQRGDLKWWDPAPTIHAGNYPIIAIKLDDVKDKYAAEGVTARNLNFDCVGKSESGSDYKALGNGNNKYTGDLKCSDGSHVLIYDLSTLAFGTGGLAPKNESITFSVFQLKYADIKTIGHQLTYNVYWFQTFKSVDDVKKYVENVDHLTYEVIK